MGVPKTNRPLTALSAVCSADDVQVTGNARLAERHTAPAVALTPVWSPCTPTATLQEYT